MFSSLSSLFCQKNWLRIQSVNFGRNELLSGLLLKAGLVSLSLKEDKELQEEEAEEAFSVEKGLGLQDLLAWDLWHLVMSRSGRAEDPRSIGLYLCLGKRC